MLYVDYLRYAPCLKNVSTDEKKCANQYKKLANNHGANPDDPNADDVNYGLKLHCCAFTDFVDCQHEYILRDCGHHAHQFFQSQVDRMSGSLLNEHCALFTHGSNACTFNPNVAASLFSSEYYMFRSLVVFISAVSTLLFFIQR
ncbi:uncharacterized protein TNIN_29621 [Trichonephila inaurata madagascariensis]|uniref:Uncharacterized protein n=1 Tax=Trichonephila inaurata madagascariensis TaxID=2747483 RepID=A0A8X6XUB7_9ARAC|nr:uncharacterized protein TNIN_29621 [Trichonephila inaurata madagascariensis]